MEEDELIHRINTLYAKSKSKGLTKEEKKEQIKLRKIYLDNIRSNFKAQMDTIKNGLNNEALN